MVMAGFLPFSAIYIVLQLSHHVLCYILPWCTPFPFLSTELYYIYTSVWGHNSYTLWGILALVFLILIVVTACITIALTYFQLSMEDYRWWWRSFASGGSTGVFIFVHSFFYYAYRYSSSSSPLHPFAAPPPSIWPSVLVSASLTLPPLPFPRLRSKMHGFLQLSFYFGYMSLVSWFFFVMLGTVGWWSALVFVRNIYRNIHVD
jgi:hypothetical protein